jgi:K+-transporting ATPase ATPase C chain
MKNLVTAILMTVVTTVLLGLIYPLVITGIAQVIFPDKANGQLIERNGQVVGMNSGASSPNSPKDASSASSASRA